MVSLLQDQSNIKFSSSDPLESNQQGDRMQTHEDSSSPVQQENPGFCCPPYDGDHRTERTHSESSQSPSPSSPSPDQIYGRFPTSQGVHAEKDTFKAPSAEKFRRYSYEESPVGTCGRFLKNSIRNPFHPYKRQFTEEVFQETRSTALSVEGHPFKTASMDDFEEMAGPTVTGEAEMYITHVPNLSSEAAWCNGLQYNDPGQEHCAQVMDTDVKLKTPPLEGQPSLYCYQSQVPQMYCPSHQFHQGYNPIHCIGQQGSHEDYVASLAGFRGSSGNHDSQFENPKLSSDSSIQAQMYPSGGSYPVTYISASHYPYQRIAPQSNQEHHQPLFPKPIYSYSILIFMALKNSKTGSLPVSEIYNFMTEHFPYFKTAPDGWKNSVRHNLSLNKCFEKVENKSGSSSRKGCLWALNPAKIDKMQEELQKWKRKDPIAVRKSMAKPDELDTLIGDKTEKLRSSMMTCNSSGVASPSVSSHHMPLQHHSLCEPPISSSTAHAVHAQRSPPAKHPLPSLLGGQPTSCYRAPQGFPQISPPFVQQLPDGPPALLPAADAQTEQRAQGSPLPAQTPPGRGIKMLPAARPVQEVLMPEGDLSNDVDALNPSLTDFDLQGNLWEELKDDSLAVDPLVLISSSPMSTQCYSSQCQDDDNNNNSLGTHTGTQHHSLPDVQLTSLYSAFMELDTGSTSYLNNSGSKPVALV